MARRIEGGGADELERYHHDDNHDAEWTSGCPHCDEERKHKGMEPL